MKRKERYLLNIFLRCSVIVVFLLSLLFNHFFLHAVDAAVGINKQINFQGKLVDNNGLNVADSSYTVVFSLYSVSSGGSALWTETDIVTTTGGVFQVALGATTALPDTVYFTSDSLYLGIKVNTDAEMTPRVRFTAVPYAINAAALDGVVATQSATGFNLQGGTSSQSTVAFTTSGGALLLQPGVAEGLTIQSNGANGLTFDTGGGAAVAIGNTNATSLVFGNTGHNPTFSFNGTGLTTLGGNLQVNGNTIQDSGGATRLTLGATTTLTNTTLTLSGTTSLGASSLSTFTMGGAGTFIGGTAAGSSLTLESTSGTGSSDFIAFKTGSQAEQMRIDSGGNVGIGTTFGTKAAQAQLDVRSDLGTLPIASLSGATAFAGLVVNNSGPGDIFTASSSGLSRFVITQNGAVGIGTRTPQATYLDISENSAAAFIPTKDFVDIGNASGQEPTADGVNALQLSWFAKPATGNVSSAQRINVANNNTTTAGQTQGLRIVTTGTGGAIASDTVGLFIDGLTNASTGTVNQNAIEVGANWDSSIFGDGDLRINANGNIILATSSATTKIGINTTAPLATFDVRGNNGTLPVASVSGKTSFASMVVNNSGSGDLLTASSGGTTRFQMANNGSTVFRGDSITSIGTGGTNTTSGAVANAIGDEGSLIPNSGFESAITGVGFADGWAVAATASAAVTRDTASSAKGSVSAKVTLNASQTTAIYSTCIPIAGQNNVGKYNLNYYLIGSATTMSVGGWLDGYTSKSNCETNTSPSLVLAKVAPTTTTWALLSGTSPLGNFSNNATWAKVHFIFTCSASCATGTTAHIDGIRLIENANTNGVDYAEDYPADPTDIPEAGDVVSLEAGLSTAMVNRSKVPLDQSAIGVVSTQPGYVLDDGQMPDPKVPVALAGRVPVKVSTINGVIHVGDYLTSSAIPGVAVKAIGAGPVIGTAMEDDTDDNTSAITEVTMFIKNTYYNGSNTTMDAGLTALSDTQDASILFTLLQGAGSATDSALTTLSQGQVTAGLNVLVSTMRKTLSATTGTTASSSASQTSMSSFSGVTTSSGATVSGELRVKGDGLIEGILHVADTLFTNNFIANGVSDFFGTVIFHAGVTFTHAPTFASDTAGFAIIKQGSDHVDVAFSTAYDQTPVVNANITLNPITPTPSETVDALQQREDAFEKAVLGENIHFIITNRSPKGFTILLDKNAGEDISFSWVALAVKSPVIFQSNTAHVEVISPTVTATPSPFDTIIPTAAASPSARL